MLALELLGCLWLCTWLCEQAVLPLLSSRFGRTCPKPTESHASSRSLLAPPPPRPGSGRSAALRPTGRARGPSTTHGGEQTRVFLPNPASTPRGSLPRLRSGTDCAARLTRVGRERGDSRTSPAPRLSPELGRERPQRPRPAAAAPAPGSLRQRGQGKEGSPASSCLLRDPPPAPGRPSRRRTQTLTPLAIAHGYRCQRKGKGSPPPCPLPLSPPPSQGRVEELAAPSLFRLPSSQGRGALGQSRAPLSAFLPAGRGAGQALCVS